MNMFVQWTTQVLLSAFSHSEKKTNSEFPHTKAFSDENKKCWLSCFPKCFFHDLFFWNYKIKTVQCNQTLSRRNESSLDGMAFHYRKNNTNTTTPTTATTPTTTSKRTHVQLRVLVAEWNVNFYWNTQASGDTLHTFFIRFGFETPYHQKLCSTYEHASPAHRPISAKTQGKTF